ncbi:MAG: peroxide stress protein YaaA [Flavobacteriales bacterium]
MLAVVSPAKSLNFESDSPIKLHSIPDFLDTSQTIINELQALSPKEISSLMNISDDLGILNYERFQQWKTPFNLSNAKQAVFAFSGDVYNGLEASSLSSENIDYAQKHFRILSGLYGILKPLDLIQAYRLEMGTKIRVSSKKDLYNLWKEKITFNVLNDLKESKTNYLLNLASNEYIKSIDLKQPDFDVITPIFKDFKNGQFKMISFFAKKARGMMARFFIENKIKNPEDLKGFNLDGYSYNEELSAEKPFTFTRIHS